MTQTRSTLTPRHAPADDAPSIELWYGPEIYIGQRGRSNRWVNVLGRVHAPVGLHDLRWQLLDRTEYLAGPLNVGPTAYRLVDPGDFNLELDPALLHEGPNRLRIEAVDRHGQTDEAEVVVHLCPEPKCELPFQVDFGSLERIDEAAHVVDGCWSLGPDGVRTRQIGYDRMLTVGSREWTDYEVLTSFTVHGYSDTPLLEELPNCGTLVSVILRWQGHVNWHDLVPYRGYRPFGIMAMHGHRFNQTSRYALYKNDDRMYPPEAPHHELEPGRRQWLRVSVQSRENQTSWYRMKAWADGHDEPDAWTFEEPGPDDELKAGSVVLMAHQTDVTFHGLEVRAVAPR
ncbi:MAG: hypothetical protein AAGG38_01070 [Planctomycetota bacterium]